MSEVVARKRPTADGEDRIRATTTILAVVARHFADSTLVRAIVHDEGPLTATLPSVVAIFGPKSTGTLIKRAASLRLYDEWHRISDLETGTLLDEAVVFRYVRHLQEISGPPTRASATCSALSFLGGLFELPAEGVRRSARIFGICSAMLRVGLVRQQRIPFTVGMVKCLEKVVQDDAGVGGPAAVISGGALFCVYARLRVGDLRRCSVEPTVDIAGATGFIETRFVEHKTAKPCTRRSLPVAAPAFGLLGPWAVQWMSSRSGARLDAARDGSLLPALADGGGWHSVPFTTNEFAKAVKCIFLENGFGEAELVGFGAHSLKCTCLSWAAKHGMDKERRRHLGYHVTPGDRVVDIYARDSMAAPLRALVEVIAAVKEGKFNPDATRSGAFKSAPLSGPASSSAAPEDPEDMACTTSSSSSSGAEAPSVVKNLTTGMLHMTSNDPERLTCGKKYPLSFDLFSELVEGPRCPRCFGALSR